MSRDEAIKSLRITNMTEKVEYCKTENYYHNGQRHYKVWWFWNWKTILQLQKSVFLNDVYIESKKISSSEEKCKYFIGYIYDYKIKPLIIIGYIDNYKIKPFSIILPKSRAYIKRYDCGTKWMYFLIEDEELLKNIMIFGIKSAVLWKKNLKARASTIKNFWKPK